MTVVKTAVQRFTVIKEGVKIQQSIDSANDDKQSGRV